MPKKAVLTDVNDIEQVRKAFEEFTNFCTELGWNREEIAWWIGNMADKMLEVE